VLARDGQLRDVHAGVRVEAHRRAQRLDVQALVAVAHVALGARDAQVQDGAVFHAQVHLEAGQLQRAVGAGVHVHRGVGQREARERQARGAVGVRLRARPGQVAHLALAHDQVDHGAVDQDLVEVQLTPQERAHAGRDDQPAGLHEPAIDRVHQGDLAGHHLDARRQGAEVHAQLAEAGVEAQLVADDGDGQLADARAPPAGLREPDGQRKRGQDREHDVSCPAQPAGFAWGFIGHGSSRDP
jgi:hypothetical protein